jgi:glucose/arabinose dehydrogenase
MKLIQIFYVLIVCSYASLTSAQNQFLVEKIAEGFDIPWAMVFLPSGDLLINQREGKVSKLNLDSGEAIEIKGLPAILVEGQGGLFDIKLSPNYHTDKSLYMTYNKSVDGKGTTVLAKAQLAEKTLINWQDIFISKARTDKQYHYGGRIAFDNNGHVFLSIGDRGVRKNGQNTLSHAGSIIRLNLDGSTPDDNPFLGNNQVLDEIWSYGHRNPQGLFFNPSTDQLWSNEHGPRGGDELNLILSGKNYGWAEVSFGKEYWAPLSVGDATERDDVEKSLKTYIPSIAPSSLLVYSGKAFPEWKHSLIAGALALEHINIISVDNKTNQVIEQRLVEKEYGRIRSITEDSNGWLYFGNDNGEIFRLKPN